MTGKETVCNSLVLSEEYFGSTLLGKSGIRNTKSMLAHLSRFIVVDLTDPSSIPQELQAFVPLLAVPVQSLLHNSKKEYILFRDLWQKYPWVLPIYRYGDSKNLLPSLKEAVINPAEKKAKELERWRR